MDTNGSFIKAYSNNWLSQFGLYKYASPIEPQPQQKHSPQNRRIALYGVLAMAFVLFFIAFFIVNKSEADKRQMITESFSNETTIESSMDHTALTTPFSSNGTSQVLTNDADNPESRESAEKSKQRRIRRLGTEAPANDLNDNLVLFPSQYLKPPKLGSVKKFSDDFAMAESFQLLESDVPRPFSFEGEGEVPVGFTKSNYSSNVADEVPEHRMNSGAADSIQDVLKQLSSTKTQNHIYYPQHQQQPSEFNNPMYQNHRVKFSGIYRHPRRNGEITTLFGAASKQHELHISKPEIINNQLTVPSGYMPDSLYNFRPAKPSDVNLLATDQYRFAPERDPEAVDRQPKGMPFSIMLDIEPMNEGNFRRPKAKKISPDHSSNNFPTYFNNHNFAQVKHAIYTQQYRPDDPYFRGSAYYHRPPRTVVPTLKPGKLMVHLNLYPKQPGANRKFELEKSTLEFGNLQLNIGEKLPDPERHKSEPTETALPNYLDAYLTGLPSITTSTEIPPSTTTARRHGAKRSTRNKSVATEHPFSGRYPPYRHVRRRHQREHPSLDLARVNKPKDFHPSEALSFDENDAI
ncbi:uncharacterized protein LOC129769481 [Toxorhynchites rutilus septentrionalis]|uniref:uncharacterized protein LOC129769481 n=1 Tax=Toxorhynchites rutilus septentrionalis TaxID=329112 RepID=UPI0024785D9B|nr:uncharacterized protein LOC129769481 [Toxorhynchites rutilus septentrionalis]